MGAFDLAFARALALWTVARPGAIEALPSITGSFAGGALAGSAAYVALHSLFVHGGVASTRRSVLSVNSLVVRGSAVIA
jgi:hypothetical protein